MGKIRSCRWTARRCRNRFRTPRERALPTITQVHDAYVAPHLSILFRSLNPSTRDEAAFAAAHTGFNSGMGFLEHYVQSAPFVAGFLPSLGDCTLLPSIVIMQKTIVPLLGMPDPTIRSGSLGRCWSAIENHPVCAAFLPDYRAAVDAMLASLVPR